MNTTPVIIMHLIIGTGWAACGLILRRTGQPPIWRHILIFAAAWIFVLFFGFALAWLLMGLSGPNMRIWDFSMGVLTGLVGGGYTLWLIRAKQQ